MKLIGDIKQELHDIFGEFLFEKNDSETWQSIVRRVSDHLEILCIYDSIYDYCVVCDESNNTPSTVSRNELIVDIDIAGTRGFDCLYRINSVITPQQTTTETVDYSAITSAVVLNQENLE